MRRAIRDQTRRFESSTSSRSSFAMAPYVRSTPSRHDEHSKKCLLTDGRSASETPEAKKRRAFSQFTAHSPEINTVSPSTRKQE